jgi:hypothetical protein
VSAAYRPGPDTGVVVSDDGRSVFVARLPGGPLLVLEGPAAVIWAEATSAPAQGWVSRVAASVDQPEDAISAEVTAFVDDLRARDLLVTAADETDAEG